MQIALMHAWQGKEKRNQRLLKIENTLTIIMNGPNPQCPTTSRFPLSLSKIDEGNWKNRKKKKEMCASKAEERESGKKGRREKGGGVSRKERLCIQACSP
jgi:hypothetical protein